MKTRSRAVAITGAVLVSAALVGCSASPQAAHTPVAATSPALPSQQEIAGLFDQWNSALATGDPQKVADLYAPNAVLLPTVSNDVRTDRAGIVDYFTKFLKSQPHGAIDEEIVDVMDPDSAVNTGLYTFTLNKEGQREQVHARYTFVYEKRDGKWLILNHHSSVLPEDH